jgi:YidC/Oxa1 family membrane protein insertase
MDRKSIIILVVSFIVLMLWYPLVVNKLYPPKPLPPGSTNLAGLPGSIITNHSPTAAPAPTALEAPSAKAVPAPLVASTNVPEDLLEVTNSTAHYTFSSYGGGLKEVELMEAVTGHGASSQTNPVAVLNHFTTAPTLAVLGGEAIQGDGIFKLTRTGTGVRAEKTLTNGLSIIKEFALSTNYLVSARVLFENHSTHPLALPSQSWVVGTATPMGPGDNGQAVGVLWYDGAKLSTDVGMSFFSSRGFACMPRTPPAEYRASASNVVWVAVHNQFFTLAAMPQNPAHEVVVQKVELPRPAGDATHPVSANSPPPEGFEAVMIYPGVTLAPNQGVTNQVYLYAGPKEYQTLARIGDRFNNNIDLVMGFSGFFGFFSKALLLSMNWLHHTLWLPYGWAIIAITIIIKVVFWPLTQASTRSMKRMQALQPQMKAIQEKYKDDPMKKNKKTMEFMKEHKVSPLGGCLPMILQIPVFFGFYRMIQSAIELRGASFLWVHDLSRPDTLFTIPGTTFPFNLLPLIMGVTMLWQARLTPPSPGMDPAQAKMMRYMPLMFMVFLYNFSAGLTLYWTVQNLLTIAQTKLTRMTPETPAAAQGSVLTPAPKKKK